METSSEERDVDVGEEEDVDVGEEGDEAEDNDAEASAQVPV